MATMNKNNRNSTYAGLLMAGLLSATLYGCGSRAADIAVSAAGTVPELPITTLDITSALLPG